MNGYEIAALIIAGSIAVLFGFIAGGVRHE